MKRFLKKILAVVLCAVMTGVTAVSLPMLVPESGITASAAVTSDKLEYVIYNNEVSITGYSGSNARVTIPSRISGKNDRCCPVRCDKYRQLCVLYLHRDEKSYHSEKCCEDR